MKLRREQKVDPNRIILSQSGIYELGGFGVLIEKYPNQRHIVKNALNGKLIDKRMCYLCGRNSKGYYFYLPIGEKVSIDDLDVLTPSTFHELIGE